MQEYRRVIAKIDLDAILHNFEEVKKGLNQNTKMLSVLKSDGYGHGAVPVANLLKDRTDYFGVSIIEEALELRNAGITNPILIFGYTSPDRFEKLLQNDIEQTIFQFDVAEKLSQTAAAIGKTAKIHIEIDTGMTRTGFPANQETLLIVEKIAALPNIEIEGIFTHFANADMREKTSEKLQRKIFVDFLDRLEAKGISIPIKHSCNSAATIEEDEHFDMVRVGLLLYGLFPSEEVRKEKLNLIPAMELKTHVIFVKTVDAGQGVSYGHTYVTDKPTKIATLPIGYADGYPRALSSKGRVIINGIYAPIIGRVCMDLMMVDVTHIEDVKVEDEVTLIGMEGGNIITAEEIGALSESFNYEIICGISKRVPKVFYKDGREFLFLSSFDDC
jgi:alanine racemase